MGKPPRHIKANVEAFTSHPFIVSLLHKLAGKFSRAASVQKMDHAITAFKSSA